jgi:hypothetical protein
MMYRLSWAGAQSELKVVLHQMGMTPHGQIVPLRSNRYS